ncbi:glycosyltransferase [Bacillus haimaensis]|uniref:glycosyltransferase n=1 Tax=Bacillus haimaensis TaxID=3160967 RepID=UPI003AA8E991
MKKTYFSMVIKADFPPVEQDDYQSEVDFFEQLTLLYLPLFSHSHIGDFDMPLTVAFSSSFLENLSDERLMRRYFSYLQKRAAFLQHEIANTSLLDEKALFSFHKEQSDKLMQLLEDFEESMYLLLKSLVESGKLIAISKVQEEGTVLQDLLVGETGFSRDSNYLDPMSDVVYERTWDEIKNYSVWQDYRGPIGIKLYKKGMKNPANRIRYESPVAHQSLEKHAIRLVENLQTAAIGTSNLNVTLSLGKIGMKWLELPDFLQVFMRKVVASSWMEWITPSIVRNNELTLFPEVMMNGKAIFNLHKKNEATFPQVVRKDLFYSSIQSHNHLIRVEKKTGKQRILMLSWEFPPSVVGGLGKHVWELANSLTTDGHHVTVLTPSFVGAPNYVRINSIHVHRIKEFHQTMDDFHLYVARFNMNMVEKAMELNAQSDFTIIHAHDWMVGLAARSIKDILSIPLVTTIHASETGRLNGQHPTLLQEMTIKQEVELIFYSDMVIVCSEYMEKELQREFAFRKEKLAVIPNGVSKVEEIEESESIKLLLERYSHQRIVLALGRMVPEKGFDIFLDAAAIILKDYPDCLFVAGGKGPLLDTYRKRVTRMGLERSIIFVGFLYEQEKNTILKYCDLMVVPSHYEPFGIVALEAMVAAKPVVASRTGGLASILDDNYSGLYFDPGDVEQLAGQIAKLLENPKLGKNLGENAREIALKDYDWEDVRRKTEYIYESTITTSSVQ